MTLANLDQYLTIPAVPTVPSSLPPSGPAGGDLAGTFPNPTLAVIGSATGPIGDATHVAAVTIDAKGRVTALTSVAITYPAAGNLTGPITSVGLATSVASQTGTGSTFAMSASPTFTGVVTAPSFTSTIATGTAPFTVTSTTVVPNLNSSMWGGFTITGPGVTNRMVTFNSATNLIATAQFLTGNLTCNVGQIGSTWTGVVIAGVQTSLAALAGQVREVLTGTPTTTYTNFAVTATYQNVAGTLALTAGDWLITAIVTFSSNTATLGGSAEFGLSSTTGALTGTTPLNVEGLSIAYVPAGLFTLVSVFQTETINIRYQVATATNVFFVGKVSFSGTAPQYTASLTATRVG